MGSDRPEATLSDGFVQQVNETYRFPAVFYEPQSFYMRLREFGPITINDIMCLLPIEQENDVREDIITIGDIFTLLEYDGGQKYVGRKYRVKSAPYFAPFAYYKILARDTTAMETRSSTLSGEIL